MKTYSWAQCMKIKYHLLVLYYKVSGNIGIKDLDQITFYDFYSMYYWVRRGSLMEEYLWHKMEEKAIDFETMESLLILSIYQLKSLCDSGCCHVKEDKNSLQKRFLETRNALADKLLAEDFPFGNCYSIAHCLYLACDKENMQESELLKKFLLKCLDKATTKENWIAVLGIAWLRGYNDISEKAGSEVFGADIPPLDNLLTRKT